MKCRPSGRPKGPGRSFFRFGPKGPVAGKGGRAVAKDVTGRIHSIESLGAADGPGVRAVVFFQGCPLRCRFCHNPDTWAFSGGQEIAAGALARRLARFKPYFGAAGGVTFSGGEPLAQPAFLESALAACKRLGLHTCLDTAGAGQGEYEAILAHTDLVLLDVKHWQPDAYRALTGRDMAAAEGFIAAMAAAGVPLWVRHVVVPGFTDSLKALRGLADYVQRLPNVQRVELLPYHTLGVHKYAALGIPYPLAGTPPMDPAACAAWQEELFAHINHNTGGKL